MAIKIIPLSFASEEEREVLTWAEESGVSLLIQTILKEKERRKELPPHERGFSVILKEPKPWMEKIRKIFGLKVKKTCQIKSLK